MGLVWVVVVVGLGLQEVVGSGGGGGGGWGGASNTLVGGGGGVCDCRATCHKRNVGGEGGHKPQLPPSHSQEL